MAKTYDGREIGKVYRFIPAKEAAEIKFFARCAIICIASSPILGFLFNVPIFASIVLSLIIAYFLHFQITLRRFRLKAENLRHFTLYRVIRESIDDHGNISTLVRWEKDGEHDWIPYAPRKRQSFRFIGD